MVGYEHKERQRISTNGNTMNTVIPPVNRASYTADSVPIDYVTIMHMLLEQEIPTSVNSAYEYFETLTPGSPERIAAESLACILLDINDAMREAIEETFTA